MEHPFEPYSSKESPRETFTHNRCGADRRRSSPFLSSPSTAHPSIVLLTRSPLPSSVTGPTASSLRDTAAAFLLDSINSDPHVRLVVHVGDIHSGSMPCTGAGLNPLPAGSIPGWNESIWDIFQQFHDPFVYTPGDNEWSDCHKVETVEQRRSLNELAAVRNLFFPTAGLTARRAPATGHLAGHRLRLRNPQTTRSSSRT